MVIGLDNPFEKLREKLCFTGIIGQVEIDYGQSRPDIAGFILRGFGYAEQIVASFQRGVQVVVTQIGFQ